MRGLGLLLLALAACEDRSYRNIGAEIRLLAERNDPLVPPAIQRLARFGRRAIPQIEIALHTASSTGKLNLIRALDTIGDDEAAPILRHFAVYDPAAEVRAAAEALLRRWSPASERARQALSRITTKRAAGEGPVVVGGK